MNTSVPIDNTPAAAVDARPPRTTPAHLALAVATILVGMSAGFFFTFQYSVILGLAEVADATYVETFQAINATIRNPAFGTVFFGSIPALGLAVALNWSRTDGIGRILLGAALPLYLVVVAVTFAGNVPLNEELAAAGAPDTMSTEDVTDLRAGFEDDWNRLNLMRTVAVIGSFAALSSVAVIGSSRDDTDRSGRRRS